MEFYSSKNIHSSKNFSNESVRLHMNENQNGVPSLVKEALLKHLSQFNCYPEKEDEEDLLRLIAKNNNVCIEQVALSTGAGSAGLLIDLARIFIKQPDKSNINSNQIIISKYTFKIHSLAASFLGITPKEISVTKNWKVDLKKIAEAITKDTKLIFLTNPGNPIGTCIGQLELEEFMKKVSENITIIIDEAYYEFATFSLGNEYADSLSLLRKYPNIVITRSFSKAFGLAGFRIGYAISSSERIKYVNQLRLPFSISSPALKVAIAVYKDKYYLNKTLEVINHQRSLLLNFLKEKKRTFIPSKTNFITVDFAKDAKKIENLLRKRDILIFPLHSYDLPNMIRITIGTTAQMREVIKILDQE